MPSDNWTDQEFMDYFMTHSKTERALFRVDHVRRMFALSNQALPPGAGRSSLKMPAAGVVMFTYGVWKPEIDRAHAFVFKGEEPTNAAT